jgi:hypothetical protein
MKLLKKNVARETCATGQPATSRSSANFVGIPANGIASEVVLLPAIFIGTAMALFLIVTKKMRGD